MECTKSAKVAFSPGIKLSIISHSSTVSVASRHTNNDLAEKPQCMKNYVHSHGLKQEGLNSPSVVSPDKLVLLCAYFAKQRSLYDFGVFLCSTVAMAQFPIFSITPAEHLTEIF